MLLRRKTCALLKDKKYALQGDNTWARGHRAWAPKSEHGCTAAGWRRRRGALCRRCAHARRDDSPVCRPVVAREEAPLGGVNITSAMALATPSNAHPRGACRNGTSHATMIVGKRLDAVLKGGGGGEKWLRTCLECEDTTRGGGLYAVSTRRGGQGPN